MSEHNTTSKDHVNGPSIMIVDNPAPFSWLPNYIVNNPAFPSDVVSASLYLHGKPGGWIARPLDIQKRFGWGVDKWQSVSRKMKELGLLHETITKHGKQLRFEIKVALVQLPSNTVLQPLKTQRRKTPLRENTLEVKARTIEINKDPKNKDIVNNHDHKVKKDNVTDVPRKLPLRMREQALSFDERCMYERLLKFKGLYEGTAMAIVEQHSIGEINNVVEMAEQSHIPNPGGYITKSLYNKGVKRGTSEGTGSTTAH